MHIIHESALKARFAEHGIQIPPGEVVSDPGQACAAAARTGYPAIVKAVIPVGDRGGKDLVAVVESDSATRRAASRLLGTETEGHRVAHLRVEALIPEGADFYLAMTFDFVRGTPLLLWGPGGSGVEQWAAPSRIPFDFESEPDCGALPGELQPVARALQEVFVELEARLVELNPVRICDGTAVVLDAKAILDPANPLPADAVAVGPAPGPGPASLAKQLAELGTTSKVTYEEFDGDVGLVMWGGGSTMITLDALERCGLRPANYSDMAAGTMQTQVISLLAETVLKLDPRALLIGSTVSSALSAAEIGRAVDAVIAGRHAIEGRTLPIAVRLAGADEPAAKELLERRPRVRHFGRDETLEDAVEWLAAELEPG